MNPKTMNYVLIAALLLSISVAVEAAPGPNFTIQALYEQCKAEDSPEYGICIGYIAGVMDTMSTVARARLPGHSEPEETTRVFGMCFKGTVSHGAALQAFKNWSEKHPERWTEGRWLGVAAALH